MNDLRLTPRAASREDAALPFSLTQRRRGLKARGSARGSAPQLPENSPEGSAGSVACAAACSGRSSDGNLVPDDLEVVALDFQKHDDVAEVWTAIASEIELRPDSVGIVLGTKNLGLPQA